VLPFDEDDTGAPRTPEYHMDDEDVEALDVDYSVRAPGDWVVSGPLGVHGMGPGRRFANIQQAARWVTEKYGTRVRHRIPEATLAGGNRWAWLIKGER
jgi:hypothetical protein